MRHFRQFTWLLRGGLWACGLTVAIGSGCQLEPTTPAPPMPFIPKEMFELFPMPSTKPDYALSDDVIAQTPNLGPKTQAK